MRKDEIIKQMEGSFIFNEGKIIVWSRNGGYEVKTNEEFLNKLAEEYLEYAEETKEELCEVSKLFPEDVENDLSINTFIEQHFDEDYGWREYFNPVEELKDEDYEYCYLIMHHVHTKVPHEHKIKTVIHSNRKIKSEDIDDILKEHGEDIPSEFNNEWANHSFSNIDEWNHNTLYENFDYHGELKGNVNYIDVD